MKCCNSCPFALTEESEYVQNLGCLPTAFDCLKMYKDEHKVWMCHSNEDIICRGLKNEIGKDFKARGKKYQTYTKWYYGYECQQMTAPTKREK